MGVRVWRMVLFIASGSLALALLRWLVPLAGDLGMFLLGAAALLIWLAAVRMLLLDSRARTFWRLWLAAGFALMLLFPGVPPIWVASATTAGIFLLLRKYKPYSYLTSRRKAALLLLAALSFFLLAFGPGSPAEPEVRIDISEDHVEPPAAPVSPLPAWNESLFNYGMSALVTFWFLSLFHLFFRIRLHFMRLRPKLAISAFLLAFVPVLLVFIMGLLTLYGTLGESRAIRASNLLMDWADRAGRDEGFVHSLTGDSFVYAEGRGFIRERGMIPDTISGFVEDFPGLDFSFADLDPAQTGTYFRFNQELWLIGTRTDEAGSLSLWGGRIGPPVLDRLARILHSDVRISFSDTLSLGRGEGEEIRTLSVRSDERPSGIVGQLEPDADPGPSPGTRASLWKRSLYFGVSSLRMFTYDEGRLGQQMVLIFLEGSLENIAGELAAGRNPLSRFVLILLLVLAILLLLLEMLAFVFGLRITTGILSAVRVLHRGTRRIAAGDLDARIEIPNEDELGDLAASFNEMAAAVKKGREEAVIRERLESELETARRIQERLLPHAMPQVPGFEIAGTSLPSQQVGGDYFDFLDMGQGQLGIAIADVSGKGIPAALLMANLQASLHAQVIRPAEVAEVASRINNLLVESTDSNMFATFFYGLLDRERSVFTSCNAGHNPPLLVRREGRIERLEAGGLLLGFMPDQEYQQESVTLEPGDILVMYTDGITEAVDTSLDSVADNLFGEEKLIDVIRRYQTGTARDLQGAVLAAIADFTDHSPQSDDITLVVIKRRGEKTRGGAEVTE